ncbi:hypothetical protein AB4K20DRAFT_1174701 [Rhizopus microsporus]
MFIVFQRVSSCLFMNITSASCQVLTFLIRSCIGGLFPSVKDLVCVLVQLISILIVVIFHFYYKRIKKKERDKGAFLFYIYKVA